MKFSGLSKKHLPLVWTLFLMFLLISLRIYFGNIRPVTYTNNYFFDDYQLLQMADLQKAFHTSDFTALNKTLSFPWFLHLIALFPWSIDTSMALYWSLAALSVWGLLKEAGANWKWALFGFAFVLFCPAAFEDQTGIRLYRNILLAPTCFLFLSLLGIELILCWKKKLSAGRLAAGSLALSVLYPFAFYMKEDGIWITLVLGAFSLICLAGVVFRWLTGRKRNWKTLLISVLILTLPFLTMKIQTTRYIEANRKYYDYPHLTIRTDGELAGFVERMYQIESKDQNIVFWAPFDTFRQAMSVSPTLASMKEFDDYVLNDSWIVSSQDVFGDYLPWVILIALDATGNYVSPAQTDSVFGTINKEIDAAFKDGRLQRADRIYLTRQAGGRTLPEVMAVFPDLLVLYNTVIFLQGYKATLALPDLSEDPPLLTKENTEKLLDTWSEKLKSDLRAPEAGKENAWKKEREGGITASRILFFTDRIITPLLFFGGTFIWFLWLLKAINYRKKKKKLPLLSWCVFWLVFLFVGCSAAYGFAIVWFSQFLYIHTPTMPIERMRWMVYYGPVMFSFLYPAILLAFVLLPGFQSRPDPDSLPAGS